jgi:hypothetical protein
MAEMKIEALCASSLSGMNAGRLQATRKWTGALTVREGQLAGDVAAEVDRVGAKLVIVLKTTGDQVVGVVTPGPLVDYLNGVLEKPATSFTDAIAKLRDTDFIDVRTMFRPPLYYCSAGKHYSTSKPCPEKH